MLNKNKAICAGLGIAFWGSAIALGATGNLNWLLNRLEVNYSFAAGTFSTSTGTGTSLPAAQIALGRVELSAGPVPGFRKVTPIAGNAISAGTPIYVYIEPTNLATRFERNGASGAVKAAMTVDYELRNAAGAVIGTQNGAWKLPVSVVASRQGPLTEHYETLTINPLSLPAGRYQLQLRVHDDFAGRFDTRTIDFELREATATLTAGARTAQQAPARR